MPLKKVYYSVSKMRGQSTPGRTTQGSTMISKEALGGGWWGTVARVFTVVCEGRNVGGSISNLVWILQWAFRHGGCPKLAVIWFWGDKGRGRESAKGGSWGVGAGSIGLDMKCMPEQGKNSWGAEGCQGTEKPRQGDSGTLLDCSVHGAGGTRM